MITITEGLAELKTLRKRIDKKRESLGPYLARAEAIRDPLEKQGGSAKHIEAEIQAVADLEANFLDIRLRIAAANDKTMIKVAGVEKSISAWLIWRREIAPHYRSWLQGMRSGIQQLRAKTQQRGGAMISSVAQIGDTKPDDIIVNVDEAKLDQQLEHIEEVLGTLDGQLSLKNATTQI